MERFIAFAKLQELIGGKPITWPGQNYFNIGLFLATVGLLVYQMVVPGQPNVFYIMIALATVIGVTMVLPIADADSPA